MLVDWRPISPPPTPSPPLPRKRAGRGRGEERRGRKRGREGVFSKKPEPGMHIGFVKLLF